MYNLSEILKEEVLKVTGGITFEHNVTHSGILNALKRVERETAFKIAYGVHYHNVKDLLSEEGWLSVSKYDEEEDFDSKEQWDSVSALLKLPGIEKDYEDGEMFFRPILLSSLYPNITEE